MALPFHKLLQTLNSGSSIGSAAVAILSSYGTDAHIYLPGIGALNGYTLGNYLESTGNTAATVDNPVGLVLDAGTAVGVELIADPEFDAPGSWALTQPTAGSVTIAGGVLRINSTDGSYAAAASSASVVSGRTYRYDITVTAMSAPYLSITIGGSDYLITGVGRYVGTVVATATGSPLIKRTTGFSPDATVTSLSIKEVPGIHVSQGTTANKPILRQSGNYYWEFDGTNDSLASTSAPFQMADDHCVVMGVSRTAVATEKHPFHVGATASVNPLAARIAFAADGTVNAHWRDDSTTLFTAASGATYTAGVPLVVSARKTGNNKVCRVNGVAGSVNSSAVGATATLDKIVFGNHNAGYFDGLEYATINVKGTVSDANLLILERWVGSLTGPTGVTI